MKEKEGGSAKNIKKWGEIEVGGGRGLCGEEGRNGNSQKEERRRRRGKKTCVKT